MNRDLFFQKVLNTNFLAIRRNFRFCKGRSFIYGYLEGDFIKLGYSSKPFNRMSSLFHNRHAGVSEHPAFFLILGEGGVKEETAILNKFNDLIFYRDEWLVREKWR